MKPFLSLLLSTVLLACVLALSSCALTPAKTDYLAWLTPSFSASGRAVIAEIPYPITMQRTPDDFSIATVTQDGLPLTFRKTPSELIFTSDGISVTMPEVTCGIPLLFELFTLDRSQLTLVRRDRAGETSLLTAVFTTDAGSITITLHEETKLPVRIEATLDGCPIQLTFDSFLSISP